MKIVAIIVTLVCCGLMFYVKREWKAAMLVMGAMTLTLVNIPGIPLHNANLLLQAQCELITTSGFPAVRMERYSTIFQQIAIYTLSMDFTSDS